MLGNILRNILRKYSKEMFFGNILRIYSEEIFLGNILRNILMK